MRPDAYRQRASARTRDYSAVLGDPAADPDVIVTLIESYWGAAFHWVAYGCQQKHGRHKESHTKLGQYLRDLGEPTIGAYWGNMETTRQSAMYAYNTTLDDATRAHDNWQAIRTWALA